MLNAPHRRSKGYLQQYAQLPIADYRNFMVTPLNQDTRKIWHDIYLLLS